ncbi:MAG: DUF2231 domain-containing protein, partial [Chloroflexota bacterium]|nr:DUF2231 domain-containing protein [Chloroflexota bacterium]
MAAVEQAEAAEATLLHRIADQQWADRLADPVQKPVSGLLHRFAALRSALDGTWLGHPVHPVMVTVPLGSWTAGMILDLMDVTGRNRDLRPATDAVHTIGLVTALGAAVFGLADWSYTQGAAKRVGVVHALANIAASGIYGASLLARSRGARGRGVALSTVGFGLVLFSGWLGGELAYHYGVGVNHAAFEQPPADWQSVTGDGGAPIQEGDVSEGALRRVQANGTPVLLTRYGGQLRAIGDTCTHLGCSLSEGQLEGDQVT